MLPTEARSALKELHALLSVTGGHPSLTEKDEARVFRRLATSMALYTLLRYQAKK